MLRLVSIALYEKYEGGCSRTLDLVLHISTHIVCSDIWVRWGGCWPGLRGDILVGSSTGLLVSKFTVNIGTNGLEALGDSGEGDEHVKVVSRRLWWCWNVFCWLGKFSGSTARDKMVTTRWWISWRRNWGTKLTVGMTLRFAEANTVVLYIEAHSLVSIRHSITLHQKARGG